MHPMKGPMITQTLRGIPEGAPFHWRGDRPTLQSFNPTFDKLMGGAELGTAEINLLADYLTTLRQHPNPNRQRDNTLPPELGGGNPVRGASLFAEETNHCASCHAGMNEGLDDHHSGARNNIDLASEIGSSQPIKNPMLGTVYQRVFSSLKRVRLRRAALACCMMAAAFRSRRCIPTCSTISRRQRTSRTCVPSCSARAPTHRPRSGTAGR